MIDFIEKNNIPLEQIGSAYPNINTFQYTDLKESKMSFEALDFNQNQYIFYANVMNDFNKKELDELQKNWKLIHILRGGQVEVKLFKKI